MEWMQDLQHHLENRPAAVAEARRQGKIVVGHYPGGYFPEELALAAGAIPVGLVRGGDYDMVERSGEYLCRWIDPFCRAQIGCGVSGDDSWYGGLDLLVIPITDNHVRAVSDVLDYNTNLEIFPFGVPHMKEPATCRYYRQGIENLKARIESACGISITEDKLAPAIELCNRERSLFRRIDHRRRENPGLLSSREFVTLQHGSQVADKQFMIELLERIDAESTDMQAPAPVGPRLLLTGSTLAWGDNLVIDLIEQFGGVVVAEAFDEGLRWFQEDVAVEGDPMAALAEHYFLRRVCPAWFRPGNERNEFLVDLATACQADGVIWYHLMFRESFKTESYYFPKILKERTGLPMLVVESDYEPSAAGNIGTRIETFMQQLDNSVQP